MRIILTIVALSMIAVAATAVLTRDYQAGIAWTIAAVGIVGWAVTWELLEDARERARRAAGHTHRASCHGPSGELQCGAWT